MNIRKFIRNLCKADVNHALASLWKEIDEVKAAIAVLKLANETIEVVLDAVGAGEDTDAEAPAEVVEPTGEAAPAEAPAEVEDQTTEDSVVDEDEDEAGEPAEPVLGLEAIQFVNACEDRQLLYEYCLKFERPITLKRNKSLAAMQEDALEHINS